MAAACALGSWNRMIPLRAIFSPISDELQFLLGRHRIPVAGPKICAEHHDAARLQQVECRRCHLEAGKTKERRARGRGRDTVTPSCQSRPSCSAARAVAEKGFL